MSGWMAAVDPSSTIRRALKRLSAVDAPEFRQPVEADTDEIAILIGQLGYAVPAEALAVRMSRILASERDFVRVAVHPTGRVVGWIHAQLTQWLESEHRAEIGGLIVEETMRRQGVGGGLVNAAACWASSRGAVGLSVRCQIHRVDAHAFYVAQGFSLSKSQYVFRRAIR